MSGRHFIIEEAKKVCELCDKIAELRPYGPNRENVCFDCGMKDPEMVFKRANEHIFGDDGSQFSAEERATCIKSIQILKNVIEELREATEADSETDSN